MAVEGALLENAQMVGFERVPWGEGEEVRTPARRVMPLGQKRSRRSGRTQTKPTTLEVLSALPRRSKHEGAPALGGVPFFGGRGAVTDRHGTEGRVSIGLGA